MTSLKKLTAVLAVSLPLAALAQTAAPAAAPAPLYQWYGTLNANIQNDYANAHAAANVIQPRQAISLDSSNIGIRGTVDTGKFGLGVVYQCETSAKIDGLTTSVGGATTTQPTPANRDVNQAGRAAVLAFLCDRNSRVGVTSAQFGTIFLGNWDTPFKAAYYGTKADDPFGNTDVFGANNIMGSPGFRRTSGGNISQVNQLSGVASFDIRAQNSIAYWSPRIQGVQLRAQMATNEFADTKRTTSPYLWSGALNYDAGPISVFVAGERHDDWQGLQVIAANAVGSTQDTAWRVGAGYELGSPFGTTTISAVAEKLYFYQSHLTGAVTHSAERPAYQVALKHRTGDHEFRARWNRADGGEAKLADGTKVNGIGLGAYEYTLGYAYNLSKSAQVYAFWTRIENERNALYVPGAGGATSGVPVFFNNPAAANQGPGNGIAAGTDPESFGLGMRYVF